MRHPDEKELALYAAHDLGWIDDHSGRLACQVLQRVLHRDRSFRARWPCAAFERQRNSRQA